MLKFSDEYQIPLNPMTEFSVIVNLVDWHLAYFMAPFLVCHRPEEGIPSNVYKHERCAMC